LLSTLIDSSSKDSSVVDGIKQFSALFAQDVKFYKFSEFILFFYRFAVGRYGGNSWQSFDLRRIGIAFHQEFLPERNLELARIERELSKQKESNMSNSALYRKKSLVIKFGS
jgi:hypothetical protein